MAKLEKSLEGFCTRDRSGVGVDGNTLPPAIHEILRNVWLLHAAVYPIRVFVTPASFPIPLIIFSRGISLTSDSPKLSFPSYHDVHLLFGSEDGEDLLGLITKSIISLPAVSTPTQLLSTASNQTSHPEVTHFLLRMPSHPWGSCTSPFESN